MYMPELSKNDVKNIILSLKNSAAGWDNFPTFMAKQCIDGYISPLTSIINKAVTQGIFPRELKLARVIPIFKSGDKQDVSNYRPISILTFFAKVLKKYYTINYQISLIAMTLFTRTNLGFVKVTPLIMLL